MEARCATKSIFWTVINFTKRFIKTLFYHFKYYSNFGNTLLFCICVLSCFKLNLFKIFGSTWERFLESFLNFLEK